MGYPRCRLTYNLCRKYPLTPILRRMELYCNCRSSYNLGKYRSHGGVGCESCQVVKHQEPAEGSRAAPVWWHCSSLFPPWPPRRRTTAVSRPATSPAGPPRDLYLPWLLPSKE